MVATCWIFVISTIISTVVSPHLHYLANYQLILNVSPHWTSRPRESRSSGFRSRYGPPGNGKLRQIQHLHLIIVANDRYYFTHKICFLDTLKIFFFYFENIFSDLKIFSVPQSLTRLVRRWSPSWGRSTSTSARRRSSSTRWAPSWSGWPSWCPASSAARGSGRGCRGRGRRTTSDVRSL